MKSLPLIRLFAACLVLVAVTSSSAQGPATTHPAAPAPMSPSLDRRIEVLIRSQFSVRPDYDMVLGARTPSDTAGYDNLPVTFTRNDKQTTVDFLISKDGITLARVEKFSIDNNPTLAIDWISGRCAERHGQSGDHQLRRSRVPLLRNAQQRDIARRPWTTTRA